MSVCITVLNVPLVEKFAICVLIIRICALMLTISRLNLIYIPGKTKNFNLTKTSHYSVYTSMYSVCSMQSYVCFVHILRSSVRILSTRNCSCVFTYMSGFFVFSSIVFLCVVQKHSVLVLLFNVVVLACI